MKISSVVCLLLAVGLCFPAMVTAATVRVTVDRNPVALGDSVTATFIASEEPDGAPDFSPLELDFEIVNQQRSSQSSWVNGKSSRTEQWQLQLMAKQPGEAQIPSIAFGADRSQPLTVHVTTAQTPAQGDPSLFMELTAAPDTVYQQAQVLLTLQIFWRVQIAQSRLSEPELNQALLEQLGEDKTYVTQRNGVEYQVLERRYALFPQQAGLLTVPAFALQTELVQQQRPRFNSFFNQPTTSSRRIASQPLTLKVLPLPASAAESNGLSASRLELSDSWSNARLQTTVGEPLTRTVTLVAHGTTVGQLPELAGQSTVDGIKTYPDQPLLKEDKLPEGLLASRQEKIALIPSKPGDYVLPAIEVRWFNTQSQQLAVARLPAVTLTVLPSAEASAAPPAPALPESASTSSVTAPLATPVAGGSGFWPWLSGFLALGWTMNVLWLLRRPKVATTAISTSGVEAAAPSVQGSIKALQAACASHQAAAAKQALLDWGRLRWGCDNLSAIAACCEPALQAEIQALNQQLYAAASRGDWQGQRLWQLFQAQQPASSAKPPSDVALEPLYKL